MVMNSTQGLRQDLTPTELAMAVCWETALAFGPAHMGRHEGRSAPPRSHAHAPLCSHLPFAMALETAVAWDGSQIPLFASELATEMATAFSPDATAEPWATAAALEPLAIALPVATAAEQRGRSRLRGRAAASSACWQTRPPKKTSMLHSSESLQPALACSCLELSCHGLQGAQEGAKEQSKGGDPKAHFVGLKGERCKTAVSTKTAAGNQQEYDEVPVSARESRP